METTQILTDIQIPQSPQWRQSTSCLEVLILGRLRRLLPGKLYDVALPVISLLKILREMQKYDVVVTANIRTGQLLGLLRTLLRIRSPKHVILELMLDQEQSRFGWKLKRLLQRWSFSSVDCIFVSSTSEVETYSRRLRIPRERIRFLPFHTNIVEPRLVKEAGNYILAAGRTGRDYAVLVEAVKTLNNMEVRIVSDEHSLRGIQLPDNVKVLTNVAYLQYLEILRNCRFVVVPLRKLVKSTGQVVILEAMALGKPVIATSTTGTVDYIQSGDTGILVAPGDSAQLRQAIIDLLNNPEMHNRIAQRALDSVKKHHTFDTYVSCVLETAYQLVTSRPRLQTV